MLKNKGVYIMNKLLLTLMLIFALFTNHGVAAEMTDEEKARIRQIDLYCAKEAGKAKNDYAAKAIYKSCMMKFLAG